MKILILVETSNIGGHTLSALTTGRELKRRGHGVTFAGGEGPLRKEIEKEFHFRELTYFYEHAGRQTYFTWDSLKTLKQLSHIVEKWEPECIHAFDARSYILASILSIQRGIPVTCTLCGGITPYYNIPACGKLIVFSKEQKEKLINVYGWKEDNVEVISTRLDMEQFDKNPEAEIKALSKEYEIDQAKRNIMMITNFLGPKIEAIKYVLKAIPPVLKQYPDVSLVMIGSRGDYFGEAKEAGEQINKTIGRKAIVFTGAVMNAQRLLGASRIVLGVGRSAFEGMAHRKPTLIVGGNGYAGTVNKDNIEEIWHYNFSGRNNKHEVSPEILRKELIRLLGDGNYYESVRNFGLDFLKSHIDIKSGIARIETAYKENALYANNRHRMHRIFNMMKILVPIFFDNYYNSLKSRFISRDVKAVGLEHS
jgi:glycosyltransferase involved in cell wall biosynthesis